MKGLTCDICKITQNEISSLISDEQGWTTIHLGMKMIGSQDYQDICPNCTMWLIDTLDIEKRRLRNK